MRRELQLRVHDIVFRELESIYSRLKRQQEARDAAGVMPRHATQTLLENKLVVEAKRKVDVQNITANVWPPSVHSTAHVKAYGEIA